MTARAWRDVERQLFETFVVRPGPDFEILHTNELGEQVLASPALVDGVWYFRTATSLLAIG